MQIQSWKGKFNDKWKYMQMRNITANLGKLEATRLFKVKKRITLQKEEL